MDGNDLLKLVDLVGIMLSVNCPVLSGNMKSNIEIVDIKDNEITICINAPFYDLDKWEKDKVIIHTNKLENGMSDYAYIVNQFGAFYRKNKSQYWVNRSIYSSVNQIANEMGAIVVNRLPLV